MFRGTIKKIQFDAVVTQSHNPSDTACTVPIGQLAACVTMLAKRGVRITTHEKFLRLAGDPKLEA